MISEAKRNIYGLGFGDSLCVHLKGHLSLCFVFGCMRYEYLCPREISEKEFVIACEKNGWNCKIDDGNCHIVGKHHYVDVTAEGEVFINGKLFTVEDQIKLEKGKTQGKYSP